MSNKAKIGWVYLLTALFIAISLYFVVKSNNYTFFATPIVLGVLLLYIFSFDNGYSFYISDIYSFVEYDKGICE